MSLGYIFDDRAQQEYETAIKWYLKRSLSAAEGFVEAVKLALKQACSHPTRWRNIYTHYYRSAALILVFEYSDWRLSLSRSRLSRVERTKYELKLKVKIEAS